jgi:hypothetical protein
MSEVRLVIREAGRDRSGTIHASCADRAVAALGADPVTMEELELATERFARPIPKGRFFANLSPGLCAEPHDAGLVVIGLVARLVVVDSTDSSPGPVGIVGSRWSMRHGNGSPVSLGRRLAFFRRWRPLEVGGRRAAPQAIGRSDPGRPPCLLWPAPLGVRREGILRRLCSARRDCRCGSRAVG